jgi:hypothetical protein
MQAAIVSACRNMGQLEHAFLRVWQPTLMADARNAELATLKAVSCDILPIS